MIAQQTYRVASSAKVQAKAAALAVAYDGAGLFRVASGTTPGLVYHVEADHDLTDTRAWRCDCRWSMNGGRNCSHVQAAAEWTRQRREANARRRARLAAARVAR